LRQPHAKKFGIKELDESYVYYCKGDTRRMLEKVSAGFKNEGLEDLINNVKVKDLEKVNPSATTKIRKEYKKSFESAFYLPVWLMANNGGGKRRFSYELDIKPNVMLSEFNPSNDQINKIKDALSEENQERKAFTITIDETSHIKHREEKAGYSDGGGISADYLTRRYCEAIENPFLSRKCAVRHIGLIQSKIGVDKFTKHFSFIASMLFTFLMEENKKLEESVFLEYLKQGKLVLAVSDTKGLGYRIPETDVISVSREPCTWKYYLFDEVELSSMNTLERKVGDVLDKQSKILWWFRNKISKQWYSIQGWHQYKIRPDFVAAKKMDNGKLELVYIIESKGEHLVGNADTEYKKKVLDLMTEQHKTGKIERVQQMSLFEVNDQAEFYLIEEKKEEETVKSLFK
jgi:type III restriction enzyme